MTVQAEQLPIAPVGRIVIMVVVLVMDRELLQLFAVEFTSAVRTDPWKQFERTLSVGLLRLTDPCHACPPLKWQPARVQYTNLLDWILKKPFM